jgi:hypothetical protein
VTPAFGVHEKLAEVVLERANVEARPSSAVAAERCCMRPTGTPEHYCGEACREAIESPRHAGSAA